MKEISQVLNGGSVEIEYCKMEKCKIRTAGRSKSSSQVRWWQGGSEENNGYVEDLENGQEIRRL